MSPNLTIAPSAPLRTTSSAMSMGVSIKPGSLILNLPELVSSAPAGTSVLFRETAAAISSKVMPRLSVRAGSIIASKTSVFSPLIFASSTSGIASILCCMSFARRCNSRSGASPHRLMVKIGRAEKLISSTIGCWASWGKSARARSTFSSTSASAASVSTSISNSNKMLATLDAATPSISFKPSMDLSSDSKGRTSKRSASSGDTPGKTTWILMKGTGISGSASLGS